MFRIPAFRRVLPALTVLLAAFVAQPATAQDGNLQIEVSSLSAVRLSGVAPFEVTLTNTGKQDVALPSNPGWDQAGGLELRISRSDDRSQALGRRAEDAYTRDAARTGSVVTLPAGQGIGVFRNVPVSEFARATGTYTVVAVYHRPGQPDVVSEAVTFEVRE